MANEKTEGQGWHGDSEGHAKAGKKGGEATARSKGPTFYEEIGSKGGKVSPGNFKNDPERARQAGKKGGEARNQFDSN
jgi:general stress protein YciG